jgi:hypothetical protein
MADWEIMNSEKLSYIEHAVDMTNDWFPIWNIKEEIKTLLEIWISPDWARKWNNNDDKLISHAEKMNKEWFTDNEIYDEIYALIQRWVLIN